MTKHMITSKTDWTEKLIYDVWEHINDIAVNDLKLDFYQPQIEIISAEQMIDAYSSIGMPVHYDHWSYGKSFMGSWQKYQSGQMGLAYEIVINSNPCISYLMEENNMLMQTLVIAHAACGHAHVFKNNYMFKDWTTAESIIDYMLFAKNYIRECEEKYGEDEVEHLLTMAHSLSSHGVDKSKRKRKRKLSHEEMLAEAVRKSKEEQQSLNLVLEKMKVERFEDEEEEEEYLDEENLLYFIYKKSPILEPWQREILRIVHKQNQYFYPQSQTKVLNEGFATHTHYYIMNELEKRGIISPDAQIAWLASHSGVTYQATYKSRHYDGNFNPYALGFGIFKDIRRICETPTKEDEKYFPKLAGTDWRAAHLDAVANYRDDSFVSQFLSPKMAREWGLFTIDTHPRRDTAVVADVADEVGFVNIREVLAASLNRVNHVPEIVVRHADMKGDRTLMLEYIPYGGKTLYENYADKVLTNIEILWGYNVELVGI